MVFLRLPYPWFIYQVRTADDWLRSRTLDRGMVDLEMLDSNYLLAEIITFHG
jgi:hypothetical protein